MKHIMTPVLCPSSSMFETSNLGTPGVMLVLIYGECVCVCVCARVHVRGYAVRPLVRCMIALSVCM